MCFIRDIMHRTVFKHKIILAILLLLFPGMRLAAQVDVLPGDRRTNTNRVLISRDVDTSGKIPTFGPNRLFFLTLYNQLGLMPGPQVFGAQTNWWSTSYAYGIRGKLRLFYWNALVMDVCYRYDRYSIRQNTPKLAPLITANHVRERISLHNFSVTLCDRINFRRRGDVLGDWIDIGVYADNIFRSTNVFVDQHYDSNGASGFHYKVKTKIVRLPYIEKVNYGLTLRIGSEFYSLFMQYRMNDLFNYDSPNNRDLPKVIVGFGFAISR